MAFDTYVQIDGVKGEALDDKHKDWIQVLGFEHEMIQPISATKGSAGGASTGRAHHGDFSITKYLDAASPKLYEALSNGKHFSKVKVEFCRAGGSQVKFMEITLEQVMISKVHLGSDGHLQDADGADPAHGVANINPSDVLPRERVFFNYGKIEWVYTQQKRSDGSGGGNVNAKFDLTAGKGS